MEQNQFPHKVLIAQTGIKFKEFSDEIKLMLDGWEKRYKGWQIRKLEANFPPLMAESKVIAQHIYNYFVEDEEQAAENGDLGQMIEDINENKNGDSNNVNNPIVNSNDDNAGVQNPEKKEEKVEETPANLSANEAALEKLLASGKTRDITLNDLKSAGFGTGFFSPLGARGCVLGKYTLQRSNPGASVYLYNLTKAA